MTEENIDKEQIRNLIQNRMAKLGITVIDMRWEKNWKVNWVGFTIDQEPLSRRDTDAILRDLEKNLWLWDKVKYQFYLKCNAYAPQDTGVACRHGMYLSPKEWHYEFRLNLNTSVNKNKWRIESL